MTSSYSLLWQYQSIVVQGWTVCDMLVLVDGMAIPRCWETPCQCYEASLSRSMLSGNVLDHLLSFLLSGISLVLSHNNRHTPSNLHTTVPPPGWPPEPPWDWVGLTTCWPPPPPSPWCPPNTAPGLLPGLAQVQTYPSWHAVTIHSSLNTNDVNLR